MAKVNEIDIWYETFGSQGNPALLLIMGGGCQGVLWPVDFCERLVKEGSMKWIVMSLATVAATAACIWLHRDPTFRSRPDGPFAARGAATL